MSWFDKLTMTLFAAQGDYFNVMVSLSNHDIRLLFDAGEIETGTSIAVR
jgi:hypothetical protein